ncbi:thioesterase family protein [Blastococcus sp. CCUG 61487]|uniref:thioesterase family protein n=1 Tax=Blastococcus sp. CCUG 61487 TaxID=1840703 RepID=UPI00113D5E7D|nr:thioesterase family protein [Blastococcus sp. CCUG 61487]TKJ27409.1 hypothetical protein A6V29_03360 [Blastococcus sp. CCUG 61487]
MTLAPSASVGAARRVTFDPSWRSFSSTQGGLVVGHLLAAAAELTGTAPRAVAAHLLGGVVPEVEAEVTAVVDRAGRTGSVRSELHQSGAVRAVAQVLTSAAPPTAPVEHYRPVSLPRPADGEPFALPREYVPIAEHLEIRALDATRPLAGGDEPRLRAWVRVDGDLPPLVQVGVLLDALPPSLFAVRTSPAAMPTVELSAHLAALPPTGDWVLVVQRTVWQDDEVAVDEVELRGLDGTPVALGRQTRRMLGG